MLIIDVLAGPHGLTPLDDNDNQNDGTKEDKNASARVNPRKVQSALAIKRALMEDAAVGVAVDAGTRIGRVTTYSETLRKI